MSHYAFDWGGVLENSPETWDVARSLLSQGHQISIISWCGEHDGARGEAAKQKIERSKLVFDHIIGFGSAPEVTLAINPDGKAEFQIGQAKARHMRAIGAIALFDDNPYICEAVRGAGLQAFRVYIHTRIP